MEVCAWKRMVPSSWSILRLIRPPKVTKMVTLFVIIDSVLVDFGFALVKDMGPYPDDWGRVRLQVID
jgi:hypothetical protein